MKIEFKTTPTAIRKVKERKNISEYNNDQQIYNT